MTPWIAWPTTTLFLALLLLACLAALLAYASATLQGRRPLGRYKSVKPLTVPEQTLYWRLSEALPECVILSQVTFSRFMATDTNGRTSFGDRMTLHNRISQKSIDFLVCLKDFTVVAAVELDDSSHRFERDAARDQLLESAGIEVLRVHVRDIPSAARLREIFTTDRRQPA